MKAVTGNVIVTGASAGIGKATVTLLARQGANVLLTARRAERLRQLESALASCPGRRVLAAGDLSEEGFAQALVAQSVAEFGSLDVLVNNAGVGHHGRLTEMLPADMCTVFDTNVLGLLYTTQAAASRMKKQGSGQIINVSSIVSHRPLPYNAVYCASKAAVNIASRSLRMELRPHGITVTLVYPGRTVTEFGEARLGQKGSHPSNIGRVSAERVAQGIVRAIQQKRSEVYITWSDWLFAHLNRLFPRTTDLFASYLAKWE
jgi:short-subunit dehydrogenase